MSDHHLLSDIGKAVVGAAILGLPAFFLRVPLILAYLFAGVLLGPHLGFGLIRDAQSISILSEIGLVLLMFILGLEIDVRKLLQAGKTVLLNGLIQFLGCAGLAYLMFRTLGYGSQGGYELTYLAFAVSLSSTLIVVKILSDQMDLDSLPSRITLGILVIQDLWAIGFLALQPNLGDFSVMAVLESLTKVGALVATAWLLARYVLPRIFARVGKQPELMLIMAMAWCFGICGLADFMNLSLEMGALTAGVAIASFPYHVDIAAKIMSLRDFFLTLFFVALGLQIPEPSLEVLTLSGLIVGFVLLSRVMTIFPVLHMMGYGNRMSLLPALNLSQLSEFSIVLGALGVTYKHIGMDLLSAFIIAMVVSALVSSFVIPKTHELYKILNPYLKKLGFNDEVLGQMDATLDKEPASVVLLGFYREASSLLHELEKRYSSEVFKQLLVVDFNPEVHRKLKGLGVNCVYGDISNVDTLRHLGLESAQLVISSIPDKVLKGTTNLKLLNHLKHLAPKAHYILTSDRFDMARKMYEEGAHYVYMPRVTNAERLADIFMRLQQQGPFEIKQEGFEVLSSHSEEVIT